ncbi:MAG: D-alanyl-D-alanine carboxypeptidase/D-alanyl-D-alanine-endopeptidase [Pseudomonadota bacterium]|nr:D-alanyl-D-alanine carboxypeptidase/D-alanyl-D-alanine-endopeptidase [Pseudomonadota bacterium]
MSGGTSKASSTLFGGRSERNIVYVVVVAVRTPQAAFDFTDARHAIIERMPVALLRRLLPAAAFFLLSTALAAPSVGVPEVDAALARAKVPADALVVLVQEVGAARPLLAWQPDQAANPASLMKLFTSYAALELLGPAWTWTTPVWLQGPVASGVLQGDLVIKGTGDPKLVLERIWLLLRRVQQQGVREIRGDIVLDRSGFLVPEQSPAEFDGEPLRPYNARADALLLNFRSVLLTFTPDPARGTARVSAEPPLAGVRVDGTVPLSAAPCEDWRAGLKADFSDANQIRFAGAFSPACGEKTWPLAYADPKTYNERVLAGMWAEMGGTLGGVVRDGVAPGNAPSFEMVSPTLPEVVRDINKYSNNVMAQQLFLTLGLTQRGIGTPETSRAVLRQWLANRFGGSAAGAVIDNGSGLSRETRVSARLLAQMLQAAWAGPLMPELMSSLPVAGIDGTLRRSRSTLGRAHLKTGSLRDVVGVAGYVLANTGRRYVLVAIINHPNANAARPVLDALVQWTANDGDPAPSPLGR